MVRLGRWSCSIFLPNLELFGIVGTASDGVNCAQLTLSKLVSSWSIGPSCFVSLQDGVNYTRICSDPAVRDNRSDVICSFPGPLTPEGNATYFWGFTTMIIFIEDLLYTTQLPSLEEGKHRVAGISKFAFASWQKDMQGTTQGTASMVWSVYNSDIRWKCKCVQNLNKFYFLLDHPCLRLISIQRHNALVDKRWSCVSAMAIAGHVWLQLQGDHLAEYVKRKIDLQKLCES